MDRRSFVTRVSAAGVLAAAGTTLPRVAHAAQPAAAPSPPPVDLRTSALADPTELTLAEAAATIRAGRLTSERLVRAYLERIERFDDVYRAWNLVLADRALADARRTRRRGGLLAGVPLAIKDNCYTRGVETSANSFLFEGFVPRFDATVVARLTGAGDIVLGKTQMGPLATTRATTPAGDITTLNAWATNDPEVSPGGSSSGSATAVAARMAASSIGTQTGGSITAPANAQGLTGLKPTMGRVSLFGIVPLTYTRDHPGPIARDARDAALMLQVMAGEDPNDPRTQGLPPVPDYVTAATPVRGRAGVRWATRVGVMPDFLGAEGLDPAVKRLRTAFLQELRGIRGVDVVEVPFPPEWEFLTGPAMNDVRLPERTEPFMTFLQDDLRGFGVSVVNWLAGALMGADEYLTGQRAKSVLLTRVLDTLETCDVVMQTEPTPFDAIGLPELALPIGFGAQGRPEGVIVGGRPFGEQRLLALAAAYQSVTDWHLRRAPDPVAVPAEASRGGTLSQAVAPAARGRIDALTAARESE